MIWIAVGLFALILFVGGYAVGSHQTWREADEEFEELEALIMDLTDQLNRALGVVNPPVEASRKEPA